MKFRGVWLQHGTRCAAAVAVLGPLFATEPSSAQMPSVTVNENVLDALGPPLTLPEMMEGPGPATDIVHLHPPRRTRTASTAPKLAKPSRGATATAGGTSQPAAGPVPLSPPSSTTAAAPAAPATPAAPAAPPPVAAAPVTPTQPAGSGSASSAPSAAPSVASTAAAPSSLPAIPPSAPAPPAAAAPGVSPTATIAATPPTLVIIPTAAAAPVAPAPVPPVPAAPAAVPPAPAAPAAAAPPAAVPAAPPAAAAPSTPPAVPTQTANLPGKAGLPAHVVFTGANTDLPDQAKPTLDAVVQALQADPQLRIELAAYASGSAEQASEARRVSLARAISVRAYLIEKGVDSKRFEVRALGNRTDGTAAAADRVDILALTN